MITPLFPGGLTPSSFVTYAAGMGVKVTEEDGEMCFQAWKKAYPEMELFLESIADPLNLGKYLGITLLGRQRHNVDKPSAMNTAFQGSSSDGSSEMLYDCYVKKIPVVNFIHDEIISELTIKPAGQLLEEVYSIEELMISNMRKVIPDVKIAVESGLMVRWIKGAEGLLDSDGDLRIATKLDNTTGDISWEKVAK